MATKKLDKVEEEAPALKELSPTEKFVKSIYEADEVFEMPPADKYSWGAWSISKLKVLRKCSFQFYLKYLLKIKVPEDVAGRPDTVSADVGSAAHLILEHVMCGKSLAESFILARKSYGPDKLTDEIWENRVKTLEVSILAFKERMDSLGRRHKIKRVFTELRIGVTKDWEPTGFFAKDVYIRGVIDLIVQLEDGCILIFDHKTGGGEGSLRPYEDQLNSYKVLFHFGIEPIKGAQSYIHFIQAGEVKPSYFSDVKEIEGKLKTMLEFDIEGAIDGVKELGFFKHVRGTYCKWCDFDNVCKSKELKPLELGTKKYFSIKPV
ncbi:MAG TPA: PD-(D/E)XK nuclease family protein [Methanosarcina sp.]|nr:PD-(D/E)XK nuclease family protein [Methanosarcina sp.]